MEAPGDELLPTAIPCWRGLTIKIVRSRDAQFNTEESPSAPCARLVDTNTMLYDTKYTTKMKAKHNVPVLKPEHQNSSILLATNC